MENMFFWKTFEGTGNVLDYLCYKYREDASCRNGENDTYKDRYRMTGSIYHTEALTDEEQKWEIQSQ